MKRRFSWGIVCLYFVICSLFLLIAQLTNVCTTAVVHMRPVDRHHTIIIDAGHGGEDGGAISCTGRAESQYNLEISLRLMDLFHLIGYKTCMIRTEDVSIYKDGGSLAAKKVSDLKERVRITNEIENATLISIHQNTFPDSKYGGAQVFYGAKMESRLLAELLQRAFCETVNPNSHRKSKKADKIYLMEHINCTGILVECGFLSNPQEEMLLQTPDYQQKLVCVIAGTVSQFLTDSSDTAIIKEK